MSKEVEIQTLVLKSINQPNQVFLNNVEPLKNEMIDYLNEHNLLDFRTRESITWKLQLYVEKIMNENLNYDDLHEITELTVEKWNNEQSFKLDYDAVKSFILHVYQSPTMRKAFGEICEGDISNYKVYTQQSELFMDYLVRTLFSTKERNIKVQTLKAVAKKVYEDHFDGDSIKALNNAFNRLGLNQQSKKNGKFRIDINLGKSFSYGRLAAQDDAPFLKGFEKIFKEMITSNPSIVDDKVLGSFFKQYTENVTSYEEANTKEHEEVEVEVEVELDLLEPENTLPTAQEETEEVVEREEVVQEDEPIVQEQTEPISDSSEFVQAIDEVIERLQQTKTLARQITLTQVEVQEDDRLSIAAEQIERLQRQLQEEQEKSKMIEESAIRHVFEYIGGHKGSYILSDLYRESMGEGTATREVVQGQLMNFFDVLFATIGLEVHGNGYSVGDELTVTREEIAKQFKLLSDLQTDNEQIDVQLVQYGWKLNGKVIVQPLIKQLKGVL